MEKFHRHFVILLALCTLINCIVFAQSDSCSYSIKGSLLDAETKLPLNFVQVKIKNTQKSTTTNELGQYSFDGLCTKNNTIIISCIGYCESDCEHHHHGDDSHIYLSKNVTELETVTIKKNNEKKIGLESIANESINKTEIKINPTKSLASTISSVNGVTISSVGTNIQLPVIHGLYGNRILIINNDLKHGFQNWGTDHAPEIDISSANSITIIKGAAGVRFGSEALAGVVLIEPNLLKLNTPLNISVSSGFQSNGNGINSSVEIEKGFGKWSYFLNGNFNKIGDRFSPNYNLTNTGKEEKSIGFGTRYHLEKFDFKVYYNYFNQNLGILRSSIANSASALINAINSDEPNIINPFSYAINAPNQETDHHFGKAEINWLYNKTEKLTLKIGSQLNKREEYDVRRNIEKPIIDLDLITNDYQLEWKHTNWFKLNGMLGFQLFKQGNTNNAGTGVTPFIPNYTTDRYSAYLIESKKNNKNLFEIGIRFDFEQNSVGGRELNQNPFVDNYQFSNISSSVGWVRELSTKSNFRTNFGTSWRLPNMVELFSFGQHGFKNTYGLLRYYFNETGELKTDSVIKFSESNISPEIGFKFINEFEYTENNNFHKITFYSHLINNYIFERPIAIIGTIRGSMPAFIFDQANTMFVGLDYSWKNEWNNNFSGIFGFSYLYSKILDSNQSLINQPPISTKYILNWNHNKIGQIESSTLSLKPSYVFRQFLAPKTISPEQLVDGSVIINENSEIFDFKDPPKGYFLLDLSWRFIWKNFNANLSINNLLNNKYRDYLNEMRYFADELGTNIILNINYNLKFK